MTEFHNYNIPSEGQANWHVPLNENFKAIDKDIEIRDKEGNRSEYAPKDGAKFLSTDTGRIYIGDGSNWQLVTPTGGSTTPNIVCYKEGDTSIAEGPKNTFTGSCIFDAAQQAVDAKLATEIGNINLFIKPGEYDLTQGLRINNSKLKRVQIRSPGLCQVKLNTGNIDSGNYNSAIEINPGPLDSDEAGDRNRCVAIAGFDMSDAGRNSREINGVYINDCNVAQVTGCRMEFGFTRGLWLRNVWQGKVDHLEINRCGSDSASTPGLQVGHSEETKTYQATNHIQLNHLQGQVDEYAYFEATGTVTRVDVNFPNIEFLNLPGFIFDSSTGRMVTQVRGSQLTGGDPSIKVIDGVQIQIIGGKINADTTAVDARGAGVPKVILGGMELSGGSSDPVVEVKNGIMNMSNLHIRDGQRGIVATGSPLMNIGNSTIRDINKAGIKLSFMGSNPHSVSNINMTNVAGNGENPITVTSTDNILVTDIAAKTPSSVPVIRFNRCSNAAYGHIVPAGSASGEIEDAGNNSFRN